MGIEPTTSGIDLPLLYSGGRGFDSHRGQKIISLPRVVPYFPLPRLKPSGLFMGLSSTLIYTSELILCSTICVPSVTRHNIHIHPYLNLIASLNSLLLRVKFISFKGITLSQLEAPFSFINSTARWDLKGRDVVTYLRSRLALSAFS